MRSILVTLFALLVSFQASAQVQVNRMVELTVQPIGTGPCPGKDIVFVPGQAIRVVRNDVPPSTTGTVMLGNESFQRNLGSVTSDSTGHLSAEVFVPFDTPVPSLAIFQVILGDVAALSTLTPITSGAQPDVNTNGISDYCEGLEPAEACTDNDVDGICDNVDGCPEFPGPTCPTGPACSDGFDNDHDGLIDFAGDPFTIDPGCDSATDTSEKTDAIECDDGKDNDGDGEVDVRFFRVDIPGVGIVLQRSNSSDPACVTANSAKEGTECDDSQDNDMDLGFDWDGDNGTLASDPDCPFPSHDVELVPEPTKTLTSLAALGALLLVTRRRRWIPVLALLLLVPIRGNAQLDKNVDEGDWTKQPTSNIRIMAPSPTPIFKPTNTKVTRERPAPEPKEEPVKRETRE